MIGGKGWAQQGGNPACLAHPSVGHSPTTYLGPTALSLLPALEGITPLLLTILHQPCGWLPAFTAPSTKCIATFGQILQAFE